MKLVYSQWSAPSSPTFDHRVIFALSVLLARQWYSDVELVTDSAGARLVERLGLPFSEVRVALDNFTVSPSAWAAGKLKAYSLQDRPFIHVDQDVFLFKRLPEELCAAPVVAQSHEGVALYERAIRHTPPDHVQQLTLPRERWGAYNAGLLGGTDTAFLRQYAETALRLIGENERFHPSSMTIYEQAWLARAAVDAGKTVSVLLQNTEDAEDLGFAHLMDCKRTGNCMTRVRERLKRMDPTMFERTALAGAG